MSRSLTIADLRPGAMARIQAVDVASDVVFRLMELGLVPGATIEMQQCAPFGDPMCLRVGSARLSLRRREAGCFRVEVGHLP